MVNLWLIYDTNPLTPRFIFTWKKQNVPKKRRGKAFWEPSQIRQALGTDANIPAEARIITPSIETVPRPGAPWHRELPGNGCENAVAIRWVQMEGKFIYQQTIYIIAHHSSS